MITWRPITELPDELKDGRPILLWLRHGPKVCRAYRGGELRNDTDGELPDDAQPTHFAEINAPEGAGNG